MPHAATTRGRSPLLVLLAAALAGCLTSPLPGAEGPDPGASATPPWAAEHAWTQHPGGGTARTEVAAAPVGDHILVLGGFVAAGPNVGPLALGPNVPLAEVVDPATGAWEVAPPYPLPVHHTALTPHAGGVIAWGGFTTDLFQAQAGVFRWAPGQPAWEPLTVLPVARAAHAAVLLEGKVVVFGGFGADRALLARVDVFDLASGQWSPGPDLPTPRDHLAGVALGGKVYAVGGEEGGHDANVADVHAWDLRSGSWQSVAPLPRPRGSLGAAVLDGRILAIGGQDMERTFDDVDAYDPAWDAWSPVAPLPTARHGLGIAAVEGRVYVLHGGPRPGLSVTDAVESFGPRTSR